MNEKEVVEVQVKDKKKKSSPIYVFILLVIALIVGFGYFTYFSTLENLFYYDVEEEENNNNNDNNNDEIVIKEIDLSKGINTSLKYELTESNSYNDKLGLRINLDNDKVTVTQSSVFNKTVSNITHSTYEAVDLTYEVTGLVGKVKSALVGGIGQDVTSTMLFFVMEDGTVEYVSMFKRNTDASGNLYFTIALESDNKYYSKGKVNNLDSIVKVYNALYAGGGTVLVAKADGSFYDLSSFIK